MANFQEANEEMNGLDAGTMEINDNAEHGQKGEEESPSPVPKTVKPKSVNTKRAVSLPLARIKQIMKMDPEVHMASSESVFLIAKCAEVFVEMLTKEAFSYTTSSKKKTVQKRDIDSAINNLEQLAFLDSSLD